MNFEMRLDWAVDSKATFERLQEPTKKLVYEGLGQLAQKSFLSYQRRPDEMDDINMVSHLQLPRLNVWLELTTRCFMDGQELVLLVQGLRETSAAEAVDQKIASLEKLKKIHLERARKMIEADGGSMYPFDILASAVYKRSMSLIDGFLKMIPSNFICAAPLVRLQVDNLLRFSAANRVSVNAHAFAMDVMSGIPVRKMRDKDNPKQFLTDQYLVQKLKHIEPRIESLYEETSGYIHLSEKHIYNAMRFNDEKGGAFEFCVSEKDQYITDEDRVEALTAMIVITEKLLWLLEGWTFVKDNPEVAKAAWDKGQEFLIK